VKPNPIVIVALLLPSPIFAASAYTHCKPGETIVFSCSTGSRVLSVCASPDISKNAGYLQYRYGLKDNPEFVYPETPQHPAGLFTPGTQPLAGGGMTFLQFKNGAYTYTVFSALGKFGKSCGTPQEQAPTCLRTIDGVAVQSNGREVANIPCRQDGNHVEGQFGPVFWEKIGFGNSETQPEFDIPDAFFRN
jgi:hypothetical protein